MDRFLTTDRFLGCMNVRTGSILLGFFELTVASFQLLRFICMRQITYPYPELMQFPVAPYVALPSTLIALVLSVLYLLGIFYNKSAFLAPQVVCNIAVFFIFVIVAMIFTILSFGQLYPVFFVAGVLIWHLTAVPYSLYRKINEYENKPSYSNGVEYQMTIVPQDPGWQV